MKKNQAFLALLVGLLLVMALTAGCTKKPQGETKAVIGKPAPDFILSDLNGKRWRLSQLRNKVVFLNFWATWCPYCREEIPSMEALSKEMTMSGQPFQMITVLFKDTPARGALFAKEHHLTFPILVDPGGKARTEYGITGVPETFIIDTHGILRQRYIGPRPWNSPGAQKMLEQYLPKGAD